MGSVDDLVRGEQSEEVVVVVARMMKVTKGSGDEGGGEVAQLHAMVEGRRCVVVDPSPSLPSCPRQPCNASPAARTGRDYYSSASRRLQAIGLASTGLRPLRTLHSTLLATCAGHGTGDAVQILQPSHSTGREGVVAGEVGGRRGEAGLLRT